MNFLLKIVEGPNKGAEIALVDGVAVTLGKGDDCDIVLADPTLPDEPVALEATDSGVTAGGEPLAPFAVKTLGATSFAVGPADAPWEELKWPEREVEGQKVEEGAVPEERHEDVSSSTPPHAEAEKKAAPVEEKRHRGCFGCLLALVVLLMLLACLAWFFWHSIGESGRLGQIGEVGRSWYSRMSRGSGKANDAAPVKNASLAEIAAEYGLSCVESGGVARVSGNLATRRERLAATAAAFAARPGVELDISDDESFLTAAEDALFTLTEGAVKVLAATNRCVALSGFSASPQALTRILESLNADLPKLRGIDVSRVSFASVAGHPVASTGGDEEGPVYLASPAAPRKAASPKPSLPVCGILTTPYPCLVLKNGARLLEGATVGGSVILKIEADSVTLTNSTGRFTWKP